MEVNEIQNKIINRKKYEKNYLQNSDPERTIKIWK